MPGRSIDLRALQMLCDVICISRLWEYSLDVQPGSIGVIDALTMRINDVDVVFHIGDISYATGFLVEWDSFLELISPVAAKVSYMTAIGNHERYKLLSSNLRSHPLASHKPLTWNLSPDIVEFLPLFNIIYRIVPPPEERFISAWTLYICAQWFLSFFLSCFLSPNPSCRDYPDSGSIYTKTDSGGECGVPYETYFQMPAPGSDKPWYSFASGPVHFTVMSTEHNWTRGSEQV